MNIPVMEQLSIRNGLREKLFHFYGQTFQNLHRILETAEEFDSYICMHSALDQEIAFNAQIILQEVIDDYWAALLCFQNGFTKQSQEILRNTLELIIQLLYLRFLKKSGSNEIDSWVSGTRGIEKVSQKIEALKSTDFFQKERLHTRFNQMYDLLCTSTHSRKDRMTSLNMPRMMCAKEMPSFEPSEILYTKGLLISLMDLELRSILALLKEGTQSKWISRINAMLAKMIDQTASYKATIDRFKKGYLVHREHAVIDKSLQVLYSIRLDGTWVFPGKKPKLTEQQRNFLQTEIQKRLLRDSF